MTHRACEKTADAKILVLIFHGFGYRPLLAHHLAREKTMKKVSPKIEDAERFVRDVLDNRVSEKIIKLVAKKVARATPSHPRAISSLEKQRA